MFFVPDNFVFHICYAVCGEFNVDSKVLDDNLEEAIREHTRHLDTKEWTQGDDVFNVYMLDPRDDPDFGY